MASTMVKGVALGSAGTSATPSPTTNEQDYCYVGSPPGFSVANHFADTGTVWVKFWMDLTAFFPSENSVNSALFDGLEEQLIAARNNGLAIILTLWKYPPWMNGLSGTTTGQFQQGDKTAAMRIPDDVSTTSIWASMITCILTAYSTGSSTPRRSGAYIDVLEICNEPNGMYWPQSTPAGLRTAGCKVGQMMQTALIISSWFGNQATAIAGPGAVDYKNEGSPDGMNWNTPGSWADVDHTDAVKFSQDVVASFTSVGFVPGTRAVFTMHNHTDIELQRTYVAKVRELALRGSWAGWPYANVNDPHLWITEGGLTDGARVRLGIGVSAWPVYRALLIQIAWNNLHNNSTSVTGGGAGIDLFTYYLFETDPAFDCGLIDSVSMGRATRPAYAVWKGL